MTDKELQTAADIIGVVVTELRHQLVQALPEISPNGLMSEAMAQIVAHFYIPGVDRQLSLSLALNWTD